MLRGNEREHGAGIMSCHSLTIHSPPNTVAGSSNSRIIFVVLSCLLIRCDGRAIGVKECAMSGEHAAICQIRLLFKLALALPTRRPYYAIHFMLKPACTHDVALSGTALTPLESTTKYFERNDLSASRATTGKISEASASMMATTRRSSQQCIIAERRISGTCLPHVLLFF